MKCLALDAVTARRVFRLERYGRDQRETPPAELLTEDEREVIGIVVQAARLLLSTKRDRPVPPDIPSWVMLLGHMAVWRTSSWRALPSYQVPWRAYVQMQGMARLWQATRGPR